MWLLMDTGFISIVVHNKNKNLMLVRARVKGDLEAFAKLHKELTKKKVKISEDPTADYRWRAVVQRDRVAQIIAHKVMTMDYTSHVKDVAMERSAPNPRRKAAYYATWSAMMEMQDAEQGYTFPTQKYGRGGYTGFGLSTAPTRVSSRWGGEEEWDYNPRFSDTISFEDRFYSVNEPWDDLETEADLDQPSDDDLGYDPVRDGWGGPRRRP